MTTLDRWPNDFHPACGTVAAHRSCRVRVKEIDMRKRKAFLTGLLIVLVGANASTVAVIMLF
jgi:hypothetical protein